MTRKRLRIDHSMIASITALPPSVSHAIRGGLIRDSRFEDQQSRESSGIGRLPLSNLESRLPLSNLDSRLPISTLESRISNLGSRLPDLDSRLRPSRIASQRRWVVAVAADADRIGASAASSSGASRSMGEGATPGLIRLSASIRNAPGRRDPLAGREPFEHGVAVARAGAEHDDSAFEHAGLGLDVDDLPAARVDHGRLGDAEHLAPRRRGQPGQVHGGTGP